MRRKLRPTQNRPSRNFVRLNMAIVVLIVWGQACGSFGTNTSVATQDPGPTGSSTPASPTPPTTPAGPVGRYRDPNLNNIGTNISGITYYDNNAIFADLTKAISGNGTIWATADGKQAALDAQGNPTVAAQGAVTGAYPSGEYTISWDGTGTIGLRLTNDTIGPVTVTMINGVQHNSVIMTHTKNYGRTLIFATTPPTANIHILAPDAETYPGSYFMKDYINRLRPFTTLRFMDAQNINGSAISNWSDRTWPEEGSRAKSGGLSYEDIIAIANILTTDVWVNVPVSATDDYVCRMARLFAFGEAGDKQNLACDPKAPAGLVNTVPLNSTSKLYIEYSNELWGGIPPNRAVVQNIAMGMVPSPSVIGAAALADKSLPWATDASTRTSQLVKVLEKRISDIVKTVFDIRKSQVKIVLAIQYVWADGSTPGFEFANSVYGSLSNYFDYVGTAPYFVVHNEANTDTTDEIFADITSVSLNPDPNTPASIAGYVTGNIAFAKKYNLPLISYEGGQSITNGHNYVVKNAAQHDPRMYDLYQKYFAIWNQIVGHDHLFVHYTDIGPDGVAGSFGTLIHGDDEGSEKWDALMRLSQIPGDANYDGVVDEHDCQILNDHFGDTDVWWSDGDFNHDGVVDEKDLAILNANPANVNCVVTP